DDRAFFLNEVAWTSVSLLEPVLLPYLIPLRLRRVISVSRCDDAAEVREQYLTEFGTGLKPLLLLRLDQEVIPSCTSSAIGASYEVDVVGVIRPGFQDWNYRADLSLVRKRRHATRVARHECGNRSANPPQELSALVEFPTINVWRAVPPSPMEPVQRRRLC